MTAPISAAHPLPASVRDLFAPTVTFLNTANYGLLPTSVAEAVATAGAQRANGTFESPSLDEVVDRCRAYFGELTGYAPGQVAVGTQVSQLVSLIAATLPAGASVVVPEGEFTSVLWPFLARPDLRVRTAPLTGLAEALRPGDDLVAVSVVQSADGAVADTAAVVAAARTCGARVLFDLSQAAGWYPVRDLGADWVVSVGFKWLLGPKGTSFLAGTDEALALLRPLAAGWYAGYNPWETCYGGPLRLASDASRFDLSPVWEASTGQQLALELVSGIGIDAIHRHDLALADRLRAGLGLPQGDSAIVSIEVPPERLLRLREAGVVGSVRAGRLRLSCHLYNTDDDIDRALTVLAS
ncbi:selenocysteine lyase/cysteine desulfurase [Nocardia transvalensis]|uniref:Selenocysteine lyase/cysteine desulfurase n=1 Tax=Nocardia transvalensis TaxID=37333 RepID=A0A7W9PFM1_9NOCA|nr:aminotransferase class V-fold PLP-dependent enzyme [Nocardia transvalensis]MBB5915040.1 selenocysteine lyase/cysteine desulfurase [Nocardia transvalensis]